MRNIIITLVLVFIHSISLNVFWYDYSDCKPWEIIVEYNNSKLLNNEINDSSCSYEQHSKKILEENWLNIKESLWNIALISFDTNRDIGEVIDLLSSDSNVKTIEPNFLNKLASNWLSTNDFFWDEQWWMNYISWPDAFRSYWSKLQWWAQVVVWVIDNGVNYNHVDLKWSIWNSSSCRLSWKSISCNHWYDFYNNSSNPLPVWDNHWTHIAGIIAATVNNTKWMAGVNPYAKIASLKVTDNYKSLSTSFDDFSILKAIDFSIENGIKIINASFWGLNYSETMKEKIKEFWDRWWLFVTTAMNNWTDIDRNWAVYPCAYNLDNIICVTSVNSRWNRSSFANYWSKSVDIAAPGEWILWTTNDPNGMYTYFENFTSCNWWSRWSCWYDGTYQFNEGVISPTYNIWSSSTTLIRFDASCNWWSYLNIGFYGNWEYQLVGNLWYVSSSKNEYKVAVPPGLSSFSFRIEKDDSNTCSIDNVGVYSAKYYWGESDSYDLWDWTSMATAFVSWLASLVRALNPDLSPLQVKQLILENWDSNSNFQWITVSWKTINVKKTLDAVTNTPRSSYSNSYQNNTSNNYSSQSTVDNFMASMFGNNSNYSNSYSNTYSQPQYSSEMQDAYDFAINNWLISASSIYSADMDWYLTRIWMAKILSQFAINIAWMEPDNNKYNTYYDVPESLNAQYDNWVLLAYQLWIMWIGTHYFRPYDYVTRAEFATAVSRIIYNIDDGSNGRAYYEPHLNKLRSEWILTNIDPYRIEKRWLALVILNRIANNYRFINY
jgi:hypothetical protein